MALKDEEKQDLEEQNCDMPRDIILLRKLPMPKMVHLPNRRTFYAKYARVPRIQLSQNVRARRTYIQKNWSKKTKEKKKTGQ